MPPFAAAPFQNFMPFLAQPSLIWVKGSVGACVELPENARLPTIDPYRKLVEAAGLGHCGIEISARNRSTAAVAVQILKDAKPREIPIFGRSVSISYREVARPSAPLEPLIFADEVIK